jgi:hypothetical protein
LEKFETVVIINNFLSLFLYGNYIYIIFQK